MSASGLPTIMSVVLYLEPFNLNCSAVSQHSLFCWSYSSSLWYNMRYKKGENYVSSNIFIYWILLPNPISLLEHWLLPSLVSSQPCACACSGAKGSGASKSQGQSPRDFAWLQLSTREQHGFRSGLGSQSWRLWSPASYNRCWSPSNNTQGSSEFFSTLLSSSLA